MDKKILATMFFISLFVVLSGCTDLYNILQTYVPTPTPGPSAAPIGENAPVSSVKGVIITGQGHTITISGRGPYNVNSHHDYITLNQGDATFSIKLKGQGVGCIISMDYSDPAPGVLPIYEFSIKDRAYELSKHVDIPYTTRYCLMVNWGDDWAVSITQ